VRYKNSIVARRVAAVQNQPQPWQATYPMQTRTIDLRLTDSGQPAFGRAMRNVLIGHC